MRLLIAYFIVYQLSCSAAQAAPTGCDTPTSPGCTWTSPTLGFEMRSIAPGRIREGRTQDHTPADPEAWTTLDDGYWLGATEVTQRQWQRVMGENPVASGQLFWAGHTQGACDGRPGHPNVSLIGGHNPVVCVSWYQVLEFANALSVLDGLTPVYQRGALGMVWDRDADGYRLPTGIEWEYAAKAGNEAPFSGADDFESVCSIGNTADKRTARKFKYDREEIRLCKDPHGALAPVGVYLPNEWGLFDMTGNAWEWTWDTPAPLPTRTIRGGSWRTPPSDCSVVYQLDYEPRDRDEAIGFRLARNLPPVPDLNPQAPRNRPQE